MRYLYILAFLSLPCCSLGRPSLAPKVVPVTAQAHFFQGLMEESEGHWYRAIEHFEKAAGLDSGVARIHFHLGKCLLYVQRYDEGFAHLNKTRKYASADDYVLWYNLGEVYREMGMHVVARKCYRKSLGIFPKFEKARQALSEL